MITKKKSSGYAKKQAETIYIGVEKSVSELFLGVFFFGFFFLFVSGLFFCNFFLLGKKIDCGRFQS